MYIFIYDFIHCACTCLASPDIPCSLCLGKTSCPDKPYQEQLAAGKRVASHFSSMLPAMGISRATIQMIEARLRWQLDVLQQHLEQMPYLLSPHQPSTADFGLMGPLYAREKPCS